MFKTLNTKSYPNLHGLRALLCFPHWQPAKDELMQANGFWESSSKRCFHFHGPLFTSFLVGAPVERQRERVSRAWWELAGVGVGPRGLVPLQASFFREAPIWLSLQSGMGGAFRGCEKSCPPRPVSAMIKRGSKGEPEKTLEGELPLPMRDTACSGRYSNPKLVSLPLNKSLSLQSWEGGKPAQAAPQTCQALFGSSSLI